MTDKLYVETTKAYKNQKFLNSERGRNIRILCEYEETKQRFDAHNVHATILFFGSARAKSREQYDSQFEKLSAQRTQLVGNAELNEELKKTALDALDHQIEVLKSTEWMCPVYDKISELSRNLTAWATSGIKLAHGRLISGVSRYSSAQETAPEEDDSNSFQAFVICTGGGPGFMEAANRGASQVQGAQNIGMGISLPFENGVNKFVTESLAFEFHYFFTRKFWMVYHCQALVVAPGGVGTMDELFEVLTLKQTCKVQKDLPIVLFGVEFWTTLVNWEAMVKFGVIARRDYEGLFFTDSVEDAFKYITAKLQQNPHFEFPTSVEDI